MKFIQPSVEYWPQEAGMEGMWKQIARATRTCYQSKIKENETDENFVKRVILKPALIEGDLNSLDLGNCRFDNLRLHGGVLEHGTVYLKLPEVSSFTVRQFINNKYSRVNTVIDDKRNQWYYITSNFRVLLEHNMLGLLNIITEPTEFHPKRYTFSIITDIGVSREGNRHRANSMAEESSRYNAYDKGKYGSELTFVKPSWYNDRDLFLEGAYADKHDGFKTLFHDMIADIKDGSYKQWKANEYYMFGLLSSEFAYMGMREGGEVAQKCRQVLNLNTKTNVVYTAFKEDWIHFLKLRSSEAVSGQPHPNIKVIADMIKEQLNKITSKGI